jgi:hypothetical protein
VENSLTVEASKDNVWDSLIPRLGREFYVINNLDKDSGLINVSYSGDPREFVDCGRIRSYVQNARGERTYDFAAASPNETYEIMENGLYFVNRKMSLEGRVNIIVQATAPQKTLVTANTRYVMTKSVQIEGAAGGYKSLSDTISFNSGGRATFPGAGQSTTCVATGKLERDILKLVK